MWSGTLSVGVAAAYFMCVSASAQVIAGPAAGETANEPPNVRPDLTFDVVSIRPSKPNPDIRMFGLVPGGDEYRAIGMPLGVTALLAYFPFALGRRERLINAPSWLWNDNYDFVGKVGEADLPAWEKLSRRAFAEERNPMLQIVLQNAFADRCKLVVHRIPAVADGYALVIASHGVNRKNLADSRPDDVIPKIAQRIGLGGRMVPILSSDDPVVHFYQTSMGSLAMELSLFGAPVVDQTRLAGEFDFAVTRLSIEGNPAADWDLATLGLKIIPVKIPTESIVIDHIERPSPN